MMMTMMLQVLKAINDFTIFPSIAGFAMKALLQLLNFGEAEEEVAKREMKFRNRNSSKKTVFQLSR